MTQIIVVDPITDATETAQSCEVRLDDAFGEVTDKELIRALYNDASAKSYGEGSYTVDATADTLAALIHDGALTTSEVARELGIPISGEGVIILDETWHADDGNAEIECDADSAQGAAQEYVDDGEWGDRSETSWVSVYVWQVGIDEQGDECRVNEDKIKITLEAEEPDCNDGESHVWANPHSILGGLKENPGVQGHGGGVACTDLCLRCGCERTTDSWAQDSSDGEQGLESVEYEAGKYADEVDKLLASKVTFELRPTLDKDKYLIIATLDYRGIETRATYEVEADQEGYSNNTSDTDTWPGPSGSWPDPPSTMCDEARGMAETAQ